MKIFKKSIHLNFILAIFIFISITGCGGGSTDSSFLNENTQTPLPDLSTPKTIGGFWEGYIYSETKDINWQVFALATEYDEIRIVDSNGTQFFGTATVGESVVMSPAVCTANLNGLAGPYVTFLDGSTAGAFNIDAKVTQRSKLQGNVVFPGESGMIDLTYNTIYNRDASMENLSGLWFLPQYQGVDVNILFTIQNDGTITGHDALLSTWTGNVEIVAPEFNMYRISLTETTIGGVEYYYTGLLSLADDTVENDTVVLAVNSDQLAIAGFFSRQ